MYCLLDRLLSVVLVFAFFPFALKLFVLSIIPFLARTLGLWVYVLFEFPMWLVIPSCYASPVVYTFFFIFSFPLFWEVARRWVLTFVGSVYLESCAIGLGFVTLLTFSLPLTSVSLKFSLHSIPNNLLVCGYDSLLHEGSSKSYIHLVPTDVRLSYMFNSKDAPVEAVGKTGYFP